MGSADEYRIKLARIKESLSCFSHESVVSAVIQGMRCEGETNRIARLPWVQLFVMKLALLGPPGMKPISNGEYNEIVNRLYHMQLEASGLQDGNVALVMRTMILQQVWYQQGDEQRALSMFRQSVLLNGADDFYSREFRRLTGLSLKSYYLITLYLLTVVRRFGAGIVEINLFVILYHLTPAISAADLYCYFGLTSVRLQDLPGFIEKYRLEDDYQSEYFQETPFRHRPFILNGEQILAFSSDVCAMGLSYLVPTLLKREVKGYKGRFGDDFEKYVGRILDGAGLNVWTEKQLEKFYKSKGVTGKLVDFVVFGDDDTVLLVECKAVEPSDVVKASSVPEILKENLKGSFCKAIRQGVEAANRLASTPEFTGKRFRQIVITHEEFFIPDARFVDENIDHGLLGDLISTHGTLAMSIDEILYARIDDIENLMKAHSDGLVDLWALLERILLAQRLSGTTVMLFRDHLHAALKGVSRGETPITDEMKRYMAVMEEVFRKNKLAWRGNEQRLMATARAVLVNLHNYFDRNPI